MASWHSLPFILLPWLTLHTWAVCYAGALALQAMVPGRRQEVPEQTQVSSKDSHRNKASTFDIISKAPEMSENLRYQEGWPLTSGTLTKFMQHSAVSLLPKCPLTPSYMPVSLCVRWYPCDEPMRCEQNACSFKPYTNTVIAQRDPPGSPCETLEASRHRMETLALITSLAYSKAGGVSKWKQLFLTCSTCHTAFCPAAKLPGVQHLLHVIVKAVFPHCVLVLDTRVIHLE